MSRETPKALLFEQQCGDGRVYSAGKAYDNTMFRHGMEMWMKMKLGMN